MTNRKASAIGMEIHPDDRWAWARMEHPLLADDVGRGRG